jgi:transcriptional regulator with XRE-family HTH domain
MSISEFDWESIPVSLSSSEPIEPSPEPHRAKRLHRIRAVRREQGVSIKRAAQLMGKTVEQLQLEEQESADLRLSQVYEWQRLLEVPVSDLLDEPHAPLSAPVLRRAQLVRLMKTVQAIMERASQTAVRRLAQTMANQLLEIMPELEGVTPWHSLDRRTQNQNSRILEQTYLPPNEPR